ncbi:MAG: hypothetical protein EPN47_17265 [Acidobacteria bacterium]|nr:MAG: hypothetical protein EPN47_17265 [Acidobacteriota bacterium]
MQFRKCIAAAALVLMAASALLCQSQTQFFPINGIRPGLKGVGRTIFQGNEVQEFQVEFLGVLKNLLAPKHDVILVRLSGGPLAETGVIAGMSGSPVYVDGKLVGAVALAFPFAKEAVAGVTPIQEMLDVVPEAPKAATTGKGRQASMNLPFKIAGTKLHSDSSVRLIPAEVGDVMSVQNLTKLLPPASVNGGFTDLLLPLRFGGFSAESIQAYSPLFNRMGFQPMQGAAVSSSPEMLQSGQKGPEPGTMVSLSLVRGDLNLNVDCTVTYRKGDDVYACGHRFLMVGPTKIPFSQSHVLASVASVASSFKIDVPGPEVGTIRQDRFGAIYGVLGEKAPMIPVHIHLDSTLNTKTDYNFEIVEQSFLSPLLLNLGIVSTLSGTERGLGPSTLDLKGNIFLKGGETVRIEDVASGEINTAAVAGASVASPLDYLLGGDFPGLSIQRIDLNIVSTDEKRVAILEQVWSTKSQVRPGDHIEVTGLLRTPSGGTMVEKIPIDIPESIADKRVSLVIGSGASLNAIQNRLTPIGTTPRDLQQLVRALNRMRRNNRLYALLMTPQRSLTLQGEEYPSPPPSLVQTFLADPAVSSSVVYGNASVVGDYQTKPTQYTIEGEKTLILKVENLEN